MLLLAPLVALSLVSGGIEVQHEEIFPAEITAVAVIPCAYEDAVCNRVTFVPLRGYFQGRTMETTVNPQGFLGGAKAINFTVGMRVLVQGQMVNDDPKFVITDLVRTRSLAGLALLFLICVIALGGFAAARSLLAMILSVILLLALLLPAMLRGVSPLLVAIGGGMLITAITMLIGHGRHPKTWAALMATILSLAITAILAMLYTSWSGLSGMADEHVVTLFREGLLVDTRGLLLAGIIIGTLGVLDDITIAQASAVFELRAANSALGARELYRRALRIGSDHIAAGVNTLILAYAGTALPLLLIVASAPDPEGFFIIINREIFATEIIRALVGSIGLLAAVPLSTAIACSMAVRLPAEQGLAGHGHHH